MIRNVPDESCRENRNTHFMFSGFTENRAVCKITWKNTVQLDRPHDNMAFALYILNNCGCRYSEYVMLIALRGKSGYANAP